MTPEIVTGQLDALADDLPADAIKSGMLMSRQLVELVAEHLAKLEQVRYVLDPVMVATSGDRLLDGDAVIAIRDRLLTQATIVTPNLDEAELLTGLTVRSPEQMVAAARALVDLGAEAALVKGGHLESDILVDVLVSADGLERFTRSRISTRATHGTGCTLSAAITACLAKGEALKPAVERSLDYLHDAIRGAPGLGAGHGPVDHGVRPR